MASEPIPAEFAALASEYREKLMETVAETNDALMERYLEGGELKPEEISSALKGAFLVEEIKRIRRRVDAERSVTTAAQSVLKGTFDGHRAERRRVEDSAILFRIGRSALDGDATEKLLMVAVTPVGSTVKCHESLQSLMPPRASFTCACQV